GDRPRDAPRGPAPPLHGRSDGALPRRADARGGVLGHDVPLVPLFREEIRADARRPGRPRRRPPRRGGRAGSGGGVAGPLVGSPVGPPQETSMKRKEEGFTLIELLIVVAIIGIIAAIAIPNLLNAIDRGKQKRTMADLRSIGTPIEAYAVDNNVSPTATDANALATVLQPIYIKKMPLQDGWNSNLVYQ